MNHTHARESVLAKLVLAGAVCGLFAACADNEPFGVADLAAPDHVAAAMTGTAEVNADIATLRRVTARYHDVAAAEADGFVQALPCQELPDGGLGIPYLNVDRVDGVVTVEEPEILFYEPQRNGRLRLVGVEMVIPIAMWAESDPPMILGQEMHRNDAVGLYGIHVWTWLHNPDGIFAFLHPNVTCAFAPAD